MSSLADLVLHLDQHLVEWMALWGPWIYLLMFLVIFCETGLVVAPFLPGDSLLFALGALSVAENGLDLTTLLLVLSLAGILGDSLNYQIGRYLGPRVFERDSPFFRREYLLKTEQFYEKWGGFTIIAARFAPIVRTFAPFVAGVGRMPWRRFLGYNAIGGVVWVFTFVLAGHFFGNLPVVKAHFHLVIIAVIVFSVLPLVMPWLRTRRT